MIPEIWILISSVCYTTTEIYGYHQVAGRQKCLEQIQISTVPFVAKEGQTVKRLCDFVGHRWADMITPNTYMVHSEKDYPSREKEQICLYCKRHRVRVEKWRVTP